jgi:formamidopyrimidine-DNA glycosylase
MPELPEVQTIVSGLKKTILGKNIKSIFSDSSRVFSGRDFSKELVRGKIVDVKRRGKYIIIDLSNNRAILIHLGMTGNLFYLKKEVPKEKHDHLILRFSDSSQLRYNDPRKFGKIKRITLPESKSVPEISQLGPEPLEISFKDFADIFQKRKGRIKTSLLNQKILAGLGNIYSDEALFDAKIHPLTKINTLNREKLKSLYHSIKKILKKAIKAGGTSVDNYLNIDAKKGFFQFKLKVYGKEAKLCPRCCAKIKRIKINQRSSHFCPRCQKQTRK